MAKKSKKIGKEFIILSLEDIHPYENNPRLNEGAVPYVVESIKQCTDLDPIEVDENNVILSGHTRLLAMQQLGYKEADCIRYTGLSEAQKKKYRLLANKVAEKSFWDLENLADELEGLDFEGFDFGFGDLEGLDFDAVSGNADNGSEVVEDDYEEEPPEEPKAKLGDLWQLGVHRLICGDCTDMAVIDRLMDGVKADMVFCDPPYGMKKESEGVLNDNLNFDDLLDFNRQWIPLTFAALKDNGSWYCWGIDEPLMDIYSNILKPMQKENKITFRNLLTWDKGDAGAGGVSFMGKDGLRSFPVGSEKCLFVMCGVQGFNNNQDNYFEGWEPVRQYLVGEAEKVGLTPQKLKEICGVGMWSHWFGKSQFAFITEEHYKELQDYYSKKEYDAFKKEYDAFKKEYDELKKEYDELKKEYYSTRAYFDNTHDTMTDVWAMGRISHEEKMQAGGHATPKPIALCSRAIKSSSREGEIVLDLFGGSGSTLIACEQLNRKCYMCELNPRYVDVIIDRWEKFTGKKAVKLN